MDTEKSLYVKAILLSVDFCFFFNELLICIVFYYVLIVSLKYNAINVKYFFIIKMFTYVGIDYCSLLSFNTIIKKYIVENKCVIVTGYLYNSVLYTILRQCVEYLTEITKLRNDIAMKTVNLFALTY